MANGQNNAVTSAEVPVAVVPNVDTSSFVRQLVVDPEFSGFLGRVVEKLMLKGAPGGGVKVVAGSGDVVSQWNSAVVPVSQSGSSGSWADEVEEQFSEGSDSSVEMPSGKPNGMLGGIKFGVNPGELEAVAEPVVVESKPGGVFYSQFVRTPKAMALRALLEEIVGRKLPKGASRAIAICTHTAGTMPVELLNGKRELRMLAMVGDRALSLVAAKRALRAGVDVEGAQNKFARDLTDQAMAGYFAVSGMRKCISLAPGVSVYSKVAASALEACAGVVSSYLDEDAVGKVYDWMLSHKSVDRE